MVSLLPISWLIVTFIAALKTLIEQKGSGDRETLEALDSYVEHCLDATSYLIEKGNYDECVPLLEQCASVLKNEVGGTQPRLMYRVLYKQAELCNARGQ